MYIIIDYIVCPPNFPIFDKHLDAGRGDLCRNEKVHVFNEGWSCPGLCKAIPDKRPYCAMSHSDNSPCRVKDQTRKLYSYERIS